MSSRERDVLDAVERRRRLKPKLKDDVITLAHGAGGKATHVLVDAVFRAALGNELGDAALIEANGTRLAFTTDTYVVKPLFFPGGDIGELAVNGTINDLAVSGARPLALTAGFVIEEGFPVEDLRRVASAMAEAAARAGIAITAGDTKVVERGKGDGLYVNTTGIGLLEFTFGRVRAGDRVLVSGTLGDHGMAVMIARGELALEVELESDTAPVHELVRLLFGATEDVRWLRDPTRGGLATVLNELALETELAVVLDEAAMPVRPEVQGACEILGIDPLYVANEGKLVAVVAPEAAASAVAALREHPLGREAAVIGEVRDEPEGLVLLETAFGGSRVVDMLVGDPLPRIC